MPLPHLTCRILRAANSSAPAIYLVDSREHPLDLASAASPHLTLVHVFVPSWTTDLAPWSAPALHPDSPAFGAGASATVQALIRLIEQQRDLHPSHRGIVGYSLAGLFALYTLVASDEGPFDAAASLSGSLWYDGWTTYLADTPWQGAGRYAYLSVGTKEKRTANPRMRTVETATQRTAQLLEAKGCQVTYAPGPGNHFEHTTQRLQAGIAALAAFWEQHT